MIRRFRNCFIRDMLFAMISLLLFFIALEHGSISAWDVSFQLLIFFLYCFTVYYQDIKSNEDQKRKAKSSE